MLCSSWPLIILGVCPRRLLQPPLGIAIPNVGHSLLSWILYARRCLLSPTFDPFFTRPPTTGPKWKPFCATIPCPCALNFNVDPHLGQTPGARKRATIPLPKERDFPNKHFSPFSFGRRAGDEGLCVR